VSSRIGVSSFFPAEKKTDTNSPPQFPPNRSDSRETPARKDVPAGQLGRVRAALLGRAGRRMTVLLQRSQENIDGCFKLRILSANEVQDVMHSLLFPVRKCLNSRTISRQRLR
jgi:hypothetical protein